MSSGQATTPLGVHPGSPTPRELTEPLIDELEQKLREIDELGYETSESILGAAAFVVGRHSGPRGNLDVSYIPKLIELFDRRISARIDARSATVSS